MVDGSTRFGAFVRILLPLVAPGLVATSIFAFIQAWNEFIIAYVLLTSPENQTLTVWLAGFTTLRGTDWGPLMAARDADGDPGRRLLRARAPADRVRADRRRRQELELRSETPPVSPHRRELALDAGGRAARHPLSDPAGADGRARRRPSSSPRSRTPARSGRSGRLDPVPTSCARSSARIRELTDRPFGINLFAWRAIERVARRTGGAAGRARAALRRAGHSGARGAARRSIRRRCSRRSSPSSPRSASRSSASRSGFRRSRRSAPRAP